MLTHECLTCGVQFTKPHNPNRPYKYCTVNCNGGNSERRSNHSAVMQGKQAWNKGRTGRQPWHNTTGIENSAGWNKGLSGIYDEETRKKMGAHKIGVSPPNKGKPMPEAQRAKLRAAKLGKTGSASSAWKGGLTSEHALIRSSAEGKQWRRAVLERDLFTCQSCGQVGGKLNADHIKPFAYYPELRFDLENGRTLCVPCHKETDTYAGKAVRHKPEASGGRA